MSVSKVVSKVVSFVKQEPVAVWGVVLAAASGVLASVGVSTDTIATVDGIAALLGIPVVRGLVTPLQALEALIEGLQHGKTDADVRAGVQQIVAK